MDTTIRGLRLGMLGVIHLRFLYIEIAPRLIMGYAVFARN